MLTLIYQGARLSFYMLLLLSLPILVNTHYILELWLKTVPEHTAFFVQLVLIFALSESISQPLITAMLATGKIRNYQIIVGGLQMLNLPISYILLRLGFFPESVIIVAICISQCCLAARLIMLRGMISISIRNYLQKVYFNIITVGIAAFILPFISAQYITESFISFIVISLIAVICTIISIYFIGCNHQERLFILQKLSTIKAKINNK